MERLSSSRNVKVKKSSNITFFICRVKKKDNFRSYREKNILTMKDPLSYRVKRDQVI